MNRNFELNGIGFYIGNYTPRKNEYEKGLKYILFVKDFDGTNIDTGTRFSTLKEAKKYAANNIYMWY